MEPLLVLIVEDSPIRRDRLRSLFAGHAVQTVASGSEAIDILSGERVDVVCLDFDLADALTGGDVAAAIQRLETQPELVIVHSMNAAGAEEIRAMLPRAVVHPFAELTRRHPDYPQIRALVAAGDVAGLHRLLS